VLDVREEQLGYGTSTDTSQSHPGAELLNVVIAVVTDGPRVLLVCRCDDSSPLSWQFPSGVVKPGAKAAIVAVRETLAETGIHCSVRLQLGSRVRPVTRAFCEYFLCDYLAGDAENRDVIENVAVAWVERARLTDFILIDRLFPPILAALEANEP
jgi:8-oxo-dGTP diphosphatase